MAWIEVRLRFPDSDQFESCFRAHEVNKDLCSLEQPEMTYNHMSLGFT